MNEKRMIKMKKKLGHEGYLKWESSLLGDERFRATNIFNTSTDIVTITTVKKRQ